MIEVDKKANVFPTNYVSQSYPYLNKDHPIVYKRKILAYAKAIKEVV